MRIRKILIVFFAVAIFILPFSGNANSVNTVDGSRTLLGGLIDRIPGPFGDFVRSAYGIIDSNVIEPTTSVTEQEGPEGLWQRVDNRFQMITGIPLNEVMQKIGDMFLFFLDLFTRPFKWIFSSL